MKRDRVDERSGVAEVRCLFGRRKQAQWAKSTASDGEWNRQRTRTSLDEVIEIERASASEFYCEPVKYLMDISVSTRTRRAHTCCSAAFADMRFAGS